MKLYRYSVVWESVSDEWGDHDYTSSRLSVRTYEVVKETPCGYWVFMPFDGRRWVSKTSRKRLAHPTEAEALDAFIRRKKSHIEHCHRRLDRAEHELHLAERKL